MHKFDSIVMSALGIVVGQKFPGGTPELSEGAMALFQLAWDLDGLRCRIETGAQEMSRRFAAYADEVAQGRMYEPPTNYSTLRDLERDQAIFLAKQDAFKALFHPITGKRFTAVIEALNGKVAS